MRILVISDIAQFVTGGAEIQATRLIEAWLDAGHEVTCFGRRMGARNVTIGRHVLPVRRIFTVYRAGRAIRALSYCASLAWLLLTRQRRFDLVYTRFLGEAAATAAALKAMHLISIPVVATPANTGGSGDLAYLRTLPLTPLLIKLLDKHCGAINLIAPGMDQELKAAGFSGKNFTYIPNGIPKLPVPARHDDATRSFVSVGRLAYQKGYDILIEALALAPDQFMAGQFHIVGGGPDELALRALAERRGVSHMITWHGEGDACDVRAALMSASVFVLPSRYEGMSNAGLEAMESALPIILTACQGLDLYIDEQSGWVVPPEDPQALLAAIRAANSLAHEQLAERGTVARAIIEGNFDMNGIAKRYIGLFAELTGMSR